MLGATSAGRLAGCNPGPRSYRVVDAPLSILRLARVSPLRTVDAAFAYITLLMAR